MNVGLLLKSTQRVLVDRSPQILTAFGVAGVVTTAVLTGKASARAVRRIEKEEDRGIYLTDREVLEKVWKLYIPAAGVGVGTIACIILATRIGTRRTAALAAAYTVSEKAFVEYSEKVIEKFGDKEEQRVRDEIAQAHTDRAMRDNTSVIITGTGESLCLDKYTGRTFMSTMETLKKAQNDSNYQLLNEGYISLNEFYSKIGLDHIPTGEEVGWNSDKLIDLMFSTTIARDENGAEKPCLVMDFSVVPVRNFYKWR